MPPLRHHQPPRLAECLLGWLLRDETWQTPLGDFEEYFNALVETDGLRYARRWYWGQVLRLLPDRCYEKAYWVLVMWKNYLKIAVRNLRKHKAYALINLAGLTIGLASFLLIALYVADELSYDRYHAQADRIYRVVSDLKTPDRTFQFAWTPPAIAPALSQDFPVIEQAVRLGPTGAVVEYKGRRFRENRMLLADSTFFEVFSHPLLQGNPATALTAPFSLVLTETMARKYFGTHDPMGEIVRLTGITQPYTVTGVVADVPANAHLPFDFLISYTTREALLTSPPRPQWFNFGFYTYVVLPEGYDAEELAAQLPAFIERNAGDVQRQAGQSHTLFLQPLTDLHLRSAREGEPGATGNLIYLYLFSAIAVFILLIGCINFMNLATARSATRAREIGMRKVVGAKRWQVAGQFLSEAVLMTTLAVLLAFVLGYLALPTFNELTGKTLMLTSAWQEGAGLWLLGLVLTVGLVAGSYPAFVLSGFRPIAVLKGTFRSAQRGARLRKGLTVFQFTLSIVLIVGTLLVHAQLQHLQQRNLGFEQAQVLTINFRFDAAVQQQYERIKDTFLSHPAVVAVTTSNVTPDVNPPNWYAAFEVEEGTVQNTSLHGYVVDYDFLDTYGLQVIAGRGFSEDFATDSTEAFLINEAAVAYFGWSTPEEALGKQFAHLSKEGRIIGVMQDFHFRSLHRRVEPLALQVRRNGLSRFSLRLTPHADLLETVDELADTWSALAPHLPFEPAFLDQNLDQLYRTEQRVGQVFRVFAVLAILIACLGLFGLASFLGEQQRRNVGIRKVFGASVPQLMLLFSGRFTRLVLIAFALATPIAYFAMEAWLHAFPYRIAIGVWPFLIAGLLTLLITWLTIAYRSIQTALTNPVEALRHE